MTADLMRSYPTALPALGASKAARKPSSAERVLASGLQVLAVRRPNVALVELRLRVPFAGRADAHPARASLLGASMLFGTGGRTELEIADALAEVGSRLSISTDADRLQIGAAVLRSGLPRLLELLADLLGSASYPADLVAGERDRMVDQLLIARSQPDVLAAEARARELYGDHPYGAALPEADRVRALTPAVLRRLHRDRIRPGGASLVLVGDLSPARTLDVVEQALAEWGGGSAGRPAPRTPPVAGGPIVLVDRPGAVQSSVRLGGASLSRNDDGYAAMQLTSLIFGGYFSSRYVENIREDKGYTYSPRSYLDHHQSGTALLIDADVATEVTAPALLETRYELGRMATLPVRAEELDSARQYALGTLALSTSTQAGLASTLAALAGHELGLDWLASHRRALLAVTVDAVREQARRFLAPSRLVMVVLGDAAKVRADLGTLGEVTER